MNLHSKWIWATIMWSSLSIAQEQRHSQDTSIDSLQRNGGAGSSNGTLVPRTKPIPSMNRSKSSKDTLAEATIHLSSIGSGGNSESKSLRNALVLFEMDQFRDDNHDGLPDGWASNDPSKIEFTRSSETTLTLAAASQNVIPAMSTYLEVIPASEYLLTLKCSGATANISIKEFSDQNSLTKEIEFSSTNQRGKSNFSFISESATQRILLTIKNIGNTSLLLEQILLQETSSTERRNEQ